MYEENPNFSSYRQGETILRFMAHKKTRKSDLGKTNLASFKSACSKFRVIEEVSPFVKEESDRISRFLLESATEVPGEEKSQSI
jgi:hypothetical protein